MTLRLLPDARDVVVVPGAGALSVVAKGPPLRPGAGETIVVASRVALLAELERRLAAR